MAKTLLYSTGLDSELYRLLERPDNLLFFKSGARYEHHEEAQLNRFIEQGLIDTSVQNVIIDDTLNFRTLEQANSVVPMRNIFYLLRALEYTEVVELGVTLYDLHYDKQPDVLNALVGFVQNYYYFREDMPEGWENVRPKILTPYRHLTKGQLLSEVIKRGHNVEHIPTLRTCYDAHSEKGCGKCKSCLSKAMALAVNEMFTHKLFDKDPRTVGKKWIKNYVGLVDTYDVQVFLDELKILMDS